MAMGAEERLSDLGIQLPPVAAPVAAYVPVVVASGLAFVAGQIPLHDGRPMATGRLGDELTIEEGAFWARRCALQAMAALRAELGSLDRIRRIVKVTVWVASAESFFEQPAVANGASSCLIEVFGEYGKHARATTAAPVLPLNVPVEVEVIAELA